MSPCGRSARSSPLRESSVGQTRGAKVIEHHHLTLFVTSRFQVSLQGKCYPKEVLDAEDFSPSAQIKSHKIVFRPDPGLKKEVAKDFKLKRISSEAMA